MRKRVTMTIDSKVLHIWRFYAKLLGLSLSRVVELLMKNNDLNALGFHTISVNEVTLYNLEHMTEEEAQKFLKEKEGE